MRADSLKPGDLLEFTGEVVIRLFRDRLTSPRHINVLLRKGDRERLATYKRHRRIRLVNPS